MNGDLDVRSAARETLPTVFGYIGIAMAFGITARANGLSVLEIVLMSMITYAGSVEFVVVSLIVLHAGIGAIVLSAFLVNARAILMSTVIAPYTAHESLWKNIWLGTLLTDETFALGTSKLNYTDRRLSFSWLNTANLMAYVTWAISSGIGGVLGNMIPNPEKYGIGFALVAMFIGLLYLQVVADKSIKLTIQLSVIGIVAVLMYFGMAVMPQNALLLVVALVGCFVGVVMKRVVK
jgi:4-azaleucine resistance transporter AzlC